MTLLTRRRVLSGLVAAPLVVTTPGLLMPVKAPKWATGGIVGPGERVMLRRRPEAYFAAALAVGLDLNLGIDPEVILTNNSSLPIRISMDLIGAAVPA